MRILGGQMKTKLGAIILGVAGLFVCAGLGIAEDGELLAFDKIYKNPQETIIDKGKNIILPAVSQETAKQAAPGSAVQRSSRLVVMKELLKDIPAEDRAKFLNSLVL